MTTAYAYDGIIKHRDSCLISCIHKHTGSSQCSLSLSLFLMVVKYITSSAASKQSLPPQSNSASLDSDSWEKLRTMSCPAEMENRARKKKVSINNMVEELINVINEESSSSDTDDDLLQAPTEAQLKNRRRSSFYIGTSASSSDDLPQTGDSPDDDEKVDKFVDQSSRTRSASLANHEREDSETFDDSSVLNYLLDSRRQSTVTSTADHNHNHHLARLNAVFNKLKNLPTQARNLDEIESLLVNDPAELTDDEVLQLIKAKRLPSYKLESSLSDSLRGVSIRRKLLETQDQRGKMLEALPYENYDYSLVNGACCENVVGYMPIPVGMSTITL